MSESTTSARCRDEDWDLARDAGLMSATPGTNDFYAALGRFAESIRGPVHKMLEAMIEAVEAAHTDLFAQCASNPIHNAWGKEVSVAKLNEAARLASEARATVGPTALALSFQQRVQPWMLECFGAEIAADAQERNHRFLEEALELVQACGATASEAHQLVDYVYGRPVGEKTQEAGGVMVTLAALCLAQDLDMHAAGETELDRIWTKVEQIRAKQAAKPKHSPLAEHVPAPDADDPLERFKNPLTPYGMLVRALRIVANTSLYEMAQAHGVNPSDLSAMEFGRKPVTIEDVAMADRFFTDCGVQGTIWPLTAAMLADAALRYSKEGQA